MYAIKASSNPEDKIEFAWQCWQSLSTFNLRPQHSVLLRWIPVQQPLFYFKHSSWSMPFRSVFPTMSPQESRILWCLVEGDPIPYYVRDAPIGANVTQSKELITLSIERLNNRRLKPWKVVSLIQRACALWLSLSAQCDSSHWSRW